MTLTHNYRFAMHWHLGQIENVSDFRSRCSWDTIHNTLYYVERLRELGLQGIQEAPEAHPLLDGVRAWGVRIDRLFKAMKAVEIPREFCTTGTRSPEDTLSTYARLINEFNAVQAAESQKLDAI